MGADSRRLRAVAAGTAADVSHLIDFLPSYLFPNGERTIEQWLCAGRSLGGHATWIVLKNGALERPLLTAHSYSYRIQTPG